MLMDEIIFDGPRPIDGYGPGFFRVAGEVHRGPLLIRAGGLSGWGGLDDAGAIIGLAGEVDVVLVGTGAEMSPLPEAFRRALEQAGMGAEAMGTAAACRTYNILLSEGRRIAAALICV